MNVVAMNAIVRMNVFNLKDFAKAKNLPAHADVKTTYKIFTWLQRIVQNLRVAMAAPYSTK